MCPEIILASSSTVKKNVLDGLGLGYVVKPSEYQEEMILLEGESYPDLARRLALGKARDVAKKVKDAIVIGADSFAVFNNEPMGKPRTEENARRFLTQLSGNTHRFYTGMALIDTATGKEVVDCVEAEVTFRKLALPEIDQYIKKEEVLTAGGAYRIQGLGSILVKKINGDYYAVVGLSPSKLQEMLKTLDHDLFDYIPSKK